MTEKDELVEVVAVILETRLGTNSDHAIDAAEAAIASIRPTIEREADEKMLRKVYKVAIAHAHTRDPLGGIFDWLDGVSSDMGLDLTQDAKGDHNE